MNVRTTAKMLGVDSDADLSGTIEESVVLTAIEELASTMPEHEDLFIVAADRVRSSRSAGVEVLDPDSVFGRYRQSNEIQLRYRREVADVFVDLTIDLALRGVEMREHDDPTEATLA